MCLSGLYEGGGAMDFMARCVIYLLFQTGVNVSLSFAAFNDTALALREQCRQAEWAVELHVTQNSFLVFSQHAIGGLGPIKKRLHKSPWKNL